MRALITAVAFCISLYGKFYSIQLYTSNSKKYAENFLKQLPSKIRKKSFVYITDSHQYTVRYLVKDKIYKLKPYTKPFKNYSIVQDDPKKISKIINIKTNIKKNIKKTSNINNLNMSLNKKNKLNKKNTLESEIKKFNEKFLLSDNIKMNLALYQYDKDKINRLINKKIASYQKIEGLYKLQRYKQAEKEIFKNKSNNSQIYKAYFDMFRKHGNYVSYNFDIQKNFITNKLKIKHNEYELEIYKLKNINEIILSKKINSYVLGAGYQNSDSSSMVFKIYKNFEIDNPKIKLFSYINKNINFLNFADKEIYTVKENLVSIKTEFKLNTENKFLTSLGVAKDKYENKSFNKRFFNIDYIRRYDRHANIRFYLKNVGYSDVFTSYSEVGAGAYISEKNTYSKKLHFFANPILYYNTLDKLGYNIIVGCKKRLIKADELKLYISVMPQVFEFNLNYIYYY
ncbi:conserved hypothetical protein [Nautilia profundicola AmH]|uniref:Uncharacterized protein n=1 Tax=Nautilia profundicola (strain ATCC BAA-1463 / DSM 18972 / AmH) TaxID=598659 RepID=B9L630_NAUPA|nr:hypothetical protein [Nautilia profundicola]ACM93120.1 conserved hypothetical protein [Nautilia profundicola AmH]